MSPERRDTLDRVILTLVCIIGGFIMLSLVAQFFLLWSGRLDARDQGVFRPIFDLVAVLVGALGGYVTGQTVEKTKKEGRNGSEA